MDYSKEGKTSVKVHHGPGGQSNFSLSWDSEPTHPVKPKQTPLQSTSQPTSQTNNVLKQSSNIVVNHPVTSTTGKASVKVHNPPGGRSNIQFG